MSLEEIQKIFEKSFEVEKCEDKEEFVVIGENNLQEVRMKVFRAHSASYAAYSERGITVFFDEVIVDGMLITFLQNGDLSGVAVMFSDKILEQAEEREREKQLEQERYDKMVKEEQEKCDGTDAKRGIINHGTV